MNWGKDCNLIGQHLLHLSLTLVLFIGALNFLFKDFWTGTDRKGIWYLFTTFKMEGSLVNFSQFSRKYWRRTAWGNFWNSCGGNKSLIADCMCDFWNENFQILLTRLNLVSSYLWPLLHLRKRIFPSTTCNSSLLISW